jgi:tetratricopeptide (TPR) repeat protein
LPTEPRDDYARFVFASALLRADARRFLEDGIPILDELLGTPDQALRVEVAWLRTGAALVDFPAPESDEALAVLDEHDPVRARLYRAAVAERADPAEADAILVAGGEQPEFLIERGRLAAKADDWEKAIELYRRVTQLDPAPINQLAFADALRDAGEREAARLEALAIARRSEHPPYIRDTAYRLAYTISQERGDLEAQADIAEEWLSFDDHNPRVAWSFVWSLARLARYRDARSVIERRHLWPADEQDAEVFADVLIHTTPPEEALERLVAVANEVPGVRGVEARLAMLAVTVDAERVPPDLLEAAAERLVSYPERFPEGGMERFEIDLSDPLSALRPHLEHRAQAAAHVSDAVTRGEVPLAALAAATGRDIGSLLLGLNLLPLGFGNAPLDADELEDARQAVGQAVVWESTSINIAGGLGRALFTKIRGAFQTPTIAQAVVDDARLGAHDATAAQPAGTIGMNPTTGEIFYHTYEPGDLDRETHRANSVLDLLDGLNVSPNVDESGEGPIGKWLREDGHLENPALATAEATLAVVERTGLSLYSDDPVLRAHAKRLGVGAFGTPSLLQAMQEQGMVDIAEVEEAIAILLRSGAQGIPIDLFDPVAAARGAQWGFTPELRMFLLDARRWNNDVDANLRRWHGFLRSAAADATYAQFQRWVFRVVDAMVLALPDNDLELIVAYFVVAAMEEQSTEVERSYRRRLLTALDLVRACYGITKSVGQLMTEWQQRAKAAASEREDPEREPQDADDGGE